jgi:hypothetical protein
VGSWLAPGRAAGQAILAGCASGLLEGQRLFGGPVLGFVCEWVRTVELTLPAWRRMATGEALLNDIEASVAYAGQVRLPAPSPPAITIVVLCR